MFTFLIITLAPLSSRSRIPHSKKPARHCSHLQAALPQPNKLNWIIIFPRSGIEETGQLECKNRFSSDILQPPHLNWYPSIDSHRLYSIMRLQASNWFRQSQAIWPESQSVFWRDAMDSSRGGRSSEDVRMTCTVRALGGTTDNGDVCSEQLLQREKKR